MWIIDSTTLRLRQVADLTNEKYAVLSHTWENSGELSFQDIQDLESAKQKAGFQKVESTCSIARSKKVKYAWIDTCCIDKTSSSELSEAINSMFRWYKQSKVCYVHLSDFEPLPPKLSERERRALVDERLRGCRWFTRGWTLQELIAPTEIEFFDREWNFIGGKHDLQMTLSDITNIDESILQDSSGLHSIPVARKMSWAVGRKTTRVEDRAYSLLGIFNISMPLLYGEGHSAFLRLQQQIANESNDLSLFAWQYDPAPGQTCPMYSGIFADSPDNFSHCSTLKRHIDQFQAGREFTITNSGLRMAGHFHCPLPSRPGELILSLECAESSRRTKNQAKWLAVRLTKFGSKYLRLNPAEIATASSRTFWAPNREASKEESAGSQHQLIYIQTTMRPSDGQRVQSIMNTGIVIIYGRDLAEYVHERSGLPHSCCSEQSEQGAFVFDAHGRDNFLAVHLFKVNKPDDPNDEWDQLYSYSDWKFRDRIALVCSLQWTGTSHQLRVGLFDPAENVSRLSRSEIAQLGDEEFLQEVRDSLLVRYSDLSGFLVQSAMPTTIWTTVQNRWGWMSVRQLRQLDDNPNSSLSQWKAGYYHVLLTHRLRDIDPGASITEDAQSSP